MSTPQTVSLTYNGYVSAIAALAVEATTTNGNIVVGIEPGFNTALPQALNLAELRIQRDIGLEALLTTGSYTLTPANNLLVLGTSDFVTVETVGVTVNGALSSLLPTSKEFIQACYGDPSILSQPLYFAPYGGDQATAGQTNTNILLGPYPDIDYPVIVTGTQRAPSLNQNNTQALCNSGTTFISVWLGDLLIQASMVLISQFQRNWSAQANDEQMPGSFEMAYQALLRGAMVEEARRRWAGGAWSSQPATPVATADR
jgi:hypothetical protein